MKISKVKSAFSKKIAIAFDEHTLCQSTDCLHCCQYSELIKKKLAISNNTGEIIQLLTIVPWDLSTSKVAVVFSVSQLLKLQKFSMFQSAIQACELRLQKEILSIPERKQRVGISQETKQTVPAFYEGEEISRLLPGKKDCVSI